MTEIFVTWNVTAVNFHYDVILKLIIFKVFCDILLIHKVEFNLEAATRGVL